MKENKIKVIINKSIDEIFEFTTNPKNTHLWIESIDEEVAEKYPPEVGTEYKNRDKDYNWDFYKVLEFVNNNKFTLSDLDDDYHVKYSYVSLGSNKTEMEYYEWVNKGELEKPFTQDVLDKLKAVIESNE